MSQVQVCFCTVIGNEDFTMLDRVHGSGIDIDIRIEFLHGHFVSTGF